MKIEAGKHYRTREGWKVKIDALGNGLAFGWHDGAAQVWVECEAYSPRNGDELTLVSEWREPARVKVWLYRSGDNKHWVPMAERSLREPYVLVGTVEMVEGQFAEDSDRPGRAGE